LDYVGLATNANVQLIQVPSLDVVALPSVGETIQIELNAATAAATSSQANYEVSEIFIPGK
jgi:hypothetical protein